MKRHALTILFAVSTGNLLAADQAPTSDSSLAIVYVFGALVLILVIVVAFVAFAFARTFKGMVARESQPTPTSACEIPTQKSVRSGSAALIAPLIKRIKWVSYSVVSTIVLVSIGIVFINARSGVALPPATSTVIEQEEPDMPFTPSSEAAVIEKGKQVFMGTCSACHRADGGGNTIGPNLTDEYWLHGGKPDSVLNTIKLGVAQRGMPAWGKALKPEDLKSVTSYVLSLQGSHPADGKAPQGEKFSSLGE